MMGDRAIADEKRKQLIALLYDLMKRLGNAPKQSTFTPRAPDSLGHDLHTLSSVVASVLSYHEHQVDRPRLIHIVRTAIDALRPFTAKSARKVSITGPTQARPGARHQWMPESPDYPF